MDHHFGRCLFCKVAQITDTGKVQEMEMRDNSEGGASAVLPGQRGLDAATVLADADVHLLTGVAGTARETLQALKRRTKALWVCTRRTHGEDTPLALHWVVDARVF